MKTSPDEKHFLSQKEAAAYLGLHQNTLNKLRKTPDGPPYSRIGARLLRYKRSDLDAWMASRCQREAA